MKSIGHLSSVNHTVHIQLRQDGRHCWVQTLDQPSCIASPLLEHSDMHSVHLQREHLNHSVPHTRKQFVCCLTIQCLNRSSPSGLPLGDLHQQVEPCASSLTLCQISYDMLCVCIPQGSYHYH